MGKERAKAKERDDDRVTVYRLLCAHDVRGLNALFDRWGRAKFKRTINDGNLLHVAAASGWEETVGQLLKFNADVDAVDTVANNLTPLTWGCSGPPRASRASCIQMLLDAGADVSKSCKYSALYMCASYNRITEMKVILRHCKAKQLRIDLDLKNLYTKLSALSVAAHLGHLESVRLLLNEGAKASSQSEPFPLSVAVLGGDVLCVQEILAALSKAGVGALVDARDSHSGQTALFLSIANGDPVICDALLKASADANAVDDGKMTPLHIAVAMNRPKCIVLLLQARAIWVGSEESEESPYQLAVRLGRTLCAAELLMWRLHCHPGKRVGATTSEELVHTRLTVAAEAATSKQATSTTKAQRQQYRANSVLRMQLRRVWMASKNEIRKWWQQLSCNRRTAVTSKLQLIVNDSAPAANKLMPELMHQTAESSDDGQLALFGALAVYLDDSSDKLGVEEQTMRKILREHRRKFVLPGKAGVLRLYNGALWTPVSGVDDMRVRLVLAHGIGVEQELELLLLLRMTLVMHVALELFAEWSRSQQHGGSTGAGPASSSPTNTLE